MSQSSQGLRSGNRAGVPRARARYLTQARELEESDAPGVVSAGVFLTALLMVGVVVWAWITELNEVARAPGEVIPSGMVQKVQHFEGGMVADIHVRNGDHVQAGAPLISLKPATIESELSQLEARRAGLALRLERVDVLLDGRQPSFGSNAFNHPLLVAGQISLYRDQRASHREQIALVVTQIAQRREERNVLGGQITAVEEEIALLEQLHRMESELAEQQLVARADLINVAVRLAGATRDHRELIGRRSIADDALTEAEQRRTELKSRLRETLSNEAGEITSELAEVKQSILRAIEKLERMELRAPIAGIVKGLVVNTLNEVVEPGQTIMELVPVADELIVESRISTRDVGHVHIGQRVDVKVTSYDSTRFGSVVGTLKRISASTYLDSDQQPYYRAEISLDKDYLGVDPTRHKIIPGMTVQADILTGKKTVLDYVLKPVYRGFQVAFRER